ncbi:hypothetical protein FB451DRAFT_287235 [Mycena latifolia]|nr:hypothetical protein FB451DRAFT_287235 [Mycena latifolia]
MPSPSLPDEIISEILSPALKVADNVFSDTSRASPFAVYSESSSAFLLVCKAWLRVATPLLYHVVILRSKAQAKALSQALSKNTDLGQFIRKLRLEGGYGPSMRGILECAPNISDLVLSLEIWAADGTSGLCHGLPLINPSCVILRDTSIKRLVNKMLTNLTDALVKCFSKWDRLRILDFPYRDPRGERASQLLLALKKSTSLDKIIIPFGYGDNTAASWIAHALKETPLRVIQIKDVIPLPFRDRFLKSLDTTPGLKRMIQYTEQEAEEEWVDPLRHSNDLHVPYISPSLNPSFIPMESACEMDQDAVWKRILYYAMSVPELEAGFYPKDVPPRLPFLLVSKTFTRLAMPYYYVHAQLQNSEAISKFLGLLLKHTSIAAQVRVITGSLGRGSDGDSISKILFLTTGLEKFHGPRGLFSHALISIREFPVLSWSAFETMARCSGPTLREFSHEVKAGVDQPPAIFDSFQQLRSLDWKCRTIFDCSSETAQSPRLNNLTDLKIWSLDQTFLTALMAMELRSLRRLGLSSRVVQATAFFRTHGSKLRELDVTYGTLRDSEANIFELCPNLSFLSIHFEAFGSSATPSVADFALDKHIHRHLSKVAFDVQHISKENIRDWDIVLGAFEPTHFPNLREVELNCFLWPTTEREIAKSQWVRWAERFLKDGVSMIDKDGKKWRARLGRGSR